MNMGKGKVVAIIGAIIGIASVLLSLAVPALFSWYHIQITGGYSGGLYLTGFGSVISDPSGADYEIAMFALMGGIMVLAGAALCIVGGATEIKPLGIIGGILMIIGPFLVVLDIFMEFSEYAEIVNAYIDVFGGTVFFGSESGGGTTIFWGLWIGYFMAIFGGILGLIGGATI